VNLDLTHKRGEEERDTEVNYREKFWSTSTPGRRFNKLLLDNDHIKGKGGRTSRGLRRSTSHDGRGEKETENCEGEETECLSEMFRALWGKGGRKK